MRVVRRGLKKIHHGIVRLVRMVKENILLAQRRKKRIGIVANMHLLCCERRKFQRRPRRLFIQMKQPLQIHHARNTKDQRLIEFECRHQAFHNLRVRAGFNFQPYRPALPSQRHL